MSKENDEKSALVPRLRLPEFQEANGWNEKPLAEVCNVLQGYGFPEVLQGRGEGKYPFCKVSDISRAVAERGGLLNEAANYVGDDDLLKLRAKLIPKGATVFAKIGEALRLNRRAYVQKECLIDNNATGLKAIDGVADDYFVYLLSQLIDLNKHCGGAVPSVNKTTLEEIEVVVPGPDEQKRIADCLSSLDELITAEAQALTALKTHKKGLMQQLFPREGEAVPRLRFPEFREAGEWEEKLVEDFFDVGSSKRVLQEDWTTQGVPFYRTRELVSLSKNEPFGSEIFISEELFREISEKYGLPAEGDFLVSGVGTLGVSYQVQAQDRFYFKDGNVLWFKLKGGIAPTFFKYCFEADGIQNQILGQASVSTVGTYTIQNAKVTKFPCPANIEEQQIIAECLFSVDDIITAQTQKISALKTHKKGLMQQLFPVLDEVRA